MLHAFEQIPRYSFELSVNFGRRRVGRCVSESFFLCDQSSLVLGESVERVGSGVNDVFEELGGQRSGELQGEGQLGKLGESCVAALSLKKVETWNVAGAKERCEELHGVELDERGACRVVEGSRIDEGLLREEPEHMTNHWIGEEKRRVFRIASSPAEAVEQLDEIEASGDVLHHSRIETERAEKQRIVAFPGLHEPPQRIDGLRADEPFQR